MGTEQKGELFSAMHFGDGQIGAKVLIDTYEDGSTGYGLHLLFLPDALGAGNEIAPGMEGLPLQKWHFRNVESVRAVKSWLEELEAKFAAPATQGGKP